MQLFDLAFMSSLPIENGCMSVWLYEGIVRITDYVNKRIIKTSQTDRD
jgi:hypothetical protein